MQVIYVLADAAKQFMMAAAAVHEKEFRVQVLRFTFRV